MKSFFGPKSLSVLALLAKTDSMNRLEIERKLGTAQIDHVIGKLRQKGHVASLPKRTNELMRYRITKTGAEAIGAHIDQQESLRCRPISELPLYVPKDMPVREGSLRAYELPSRGMV